ncbi:MAG: crotonase/enoyl-CoA hydratase family protein [Pseudomonadota bacterium]
MRQPANACVVIEADGPIVSVRLNRPDKLNAVNLDLIDDLIEAAAIVRADENARVILLEGTGRSFCAGLDFASVAKEPKRMAGYLFKLLRPDNRFQRCCLVWRNLPLPVIAVIQGHCLGAGAQIAMAADFRFANPDLKLAIMEAKWGLVPDMSGTVTFPECMPIDQAKRLSMTAEPVDAGTALTCGLVTEVSETPRDAANALAAQLIERSPDALALTKRLFHRTWFAGSRWSLLWETLYQARLMRGKNHKVARSRATGNDKAYLPRTIR